MALKPETPDYVRHTLRTVWDSRASANCFLGTLLATADVDITPRDSFWYNPGRKHLDECSVDLRDVIELAIKDVDAAEERERHYIIKYTEWFCDDFGE